MKAIVYSKYGPPSVVALADVPTPTPSNHEVLIRIHATTVTMGDHRARSLDLPGGFGLFGRPVFGVFGPRKPIMKVDDMQLLARLAESGELKPVIDRCYPLADAAEAHSYVDTGHKRGSAVLSVSEENRSGIEKFRVPVH
jgi:NADPH:quinone reductase-like Zn-dependent oxidoreductase